MKDVPFIERFGGLKKDDTVTCLEDPAFMPNACLLEAVAPFCGYYNEVPGAIKPLYFFIVLDDFHPHEEVIRATLTVEKELGYHIDAVSGTISIFDHHCHIIRIRNLRQYKDIVKIQQLYAGHGLKFKKQIKKAVDEKAVVNLQKFFYLEPIEDGMFFDHIQPHHGYFPIPKSMDFDVFCSLTREVKFDTSLLFFDAALAWYVEDGKIIEMIRIYREYLTTEKLAAIRDRYLMLIKQKHIPEV
ncbi:MAG: hypothetical protein RBR28_03090 [Lentimicrobium sp.]|jgi:hypothetical protein|nr:hypothetical protein [Lentimicrobium sp.]